MTVDTSNVHSGWNIWEKASGDNFKFRYVRFKHTDLSGCKLAEIEFVGYKFSTYSVATGGDYTCDVKIVPQSIVLSNAVTYEASSTTIVTSVTPQFASSAGGDTIQIAGTNFGSSVSVMIDGVECVYVSHTST